MDLSGLGVIPDPREKKEKEKDFQSEEIATFAPVTWVRKPESDWQKYPIFNQDSSGSCVAQTVTKVLGIENFSEEGKFIHFSARDIYSRRKNYPSRGMWFQDGMKLGHEGVTLEQLMPSQNLNENAMNNFKDRTPLTKLIGKPGKGGNYLALPLSIENIASYLHSSKKAVLLGVKFGSKEWDREVPKILNRLTPYYHAITATDFTLTPDGKKALVIEDSWGTNRGINGRRLVSEEWWKQGRITGAWHFMFLQNEWKEEDEKPKAKFEKNLYYGLRNDPEVARLQECLSYLKMFPSSVTFTGNFYGITLRAVKLFQTVNKSEISKIVNYQISATGYVGKGTRGVLNRLF